MKDIVLQKLVENHGNIKATANQLSLSEERVRVIAKDFNLKSTDVHVQLAPVKATAEVPEEMRDPEWVVAHNANAVASLRDKTLANLQELQDLGVMPAALQIRLLKTLLEFEAAQRAIARPLSPTQLLFDNRQQSFTLQNMVNTLSGASLSQEALKSIVSATSRARIATEKNSPCAPPGPTSNYAHEIVDGEIC
jgi:hypothetical protein